MSLPFLELTLTIIDGHLQSNGWKVHIRRFTVALDFKVSLTKFNPKLILNKHQIVLK